MSVDAPTICLHTSHPLPSDYQRDIRRKEFQCLALSPLVASLYPLSVSFKLQFPETRLIQYDCGKLYCGVKKCIFSIIALRWGKSATTMYSIMYSWPSLCKLIRCTFSVQYLFCVNISNSNT